jgi:hypothetical protein
MRASQVVDNRRMIDFEFHRTMTIWAQRLRVFGFHLTMLIWACIVVAITAALKWYTGGWAWLFLGFCFWGASRFESRVASLWGVRGGIVVRDVLSN